MRVRSARQHERAQAAGTRRSAARTHRPQGRRAGAGARGRSRTERACLGLDARILRYLRHRSGRLHVLCLRLAPEACLPIGSLSFGWRARLFVGLCPCRAPLRVHALATRGKLRLGARRQREHLRVGRKLELRQSAARGERCPARCHTPRCRPRRVAHGAGRGASAAAWEALHDTLRGQRNLRALRCARRQRLCQRLLLLRARVCHVGLIQVLRALLPLLLRLLLLLPLLRLERALLRSGVLRCHRLGELTDGLGRSWRRRRGSHGGIIAVVLLEVVVRILFLEVVVRVPAVLVLLSPRHVSHAERTRGCEVAAEGGGPRAPAAAGRRAARRRCAA